MKPWKLLALADHASLIWYYCFEQVQGSDEEEQEGYEFSIFDGCSGVWTESCVGAALRRKCDLLSSAHLLFTPKQLLSVISSFFSSPQHPDGSSKLAATVKASPTADHVNIVSINIPMQFLQFSLSFTCTFVPRSFPYEVIQWQFFWIWSFLRQKTPDMAPSLSLIADQLELILSDSTESMNNFSQAMCDPLKFPPTSLSFSKSLSASGLGSTENAPETTPVLDSPSSTAHLPELCVSDASTSVPASSDLASSIHSFASDLTPTNALLPCPLSRDEQLELERRQQLLRKLSESSDVKKKRKLL